MAYLQYLANNCCEPACPHIAGVTVYNQAGYPLGEYCEDCANELLEDLNAHERRTPKKRKKRKK